MLVKPLVPSQIDKLIAWDSCEPETDSAAASLEWVANALRSASYNLDLRKHMSNCRTVLESAASKAAKDSQPRLIATNRLFACLLLESLLHLSVHDCQPAKYFFHKARSLYVMEADLIDKQIALEALGLVGALVWELDRRLSRIEPCF